MSEHDIDKIKWHLTQLEDDELFWAVEADLLMQEAYRRLNKLNGDKNAADNNAERAAKQAAQFFERVDAMEKKR